MIRDLAPVLPYFSAAAVVLALLVLLVLWAVLRQRVEKGTASGFASVVDGHGDDGSGGEGGNPWTPRVDGAGTRSLRASFRAARAALRRRFPGRGVLYRVPWFAMIGEAGSGKSAALGALDLAQHLAHPAPGANGTRKTIGWWVFDQGVVLDLPGDLIMTRGGGAADDPGWLRVLAHLRKVRSRRPIDGVVVTIPATDLFGLRRLPREALAEKAKRLHLKLGQMQVELGIRFPVYVLVTKTDVVTGFRNFWREAPDHRRDEMFGWSTPASSEVAYSPQWIDALFHAVGTGLSSARIDIAATTAAPLGTVDDVVLFPGEFQSMKDGLGVCLDGLFRSTANHPAFFLRGVYFCGDLEETGGAPETRGRLAFPSFLTHVFTDKIFPEHALGRVEPEAAEARGRMIGTLRIAMASAAAVLVTGLWISLNVLRADFREVNPALTEIRAAMDGGGEDGMARALGAMGRVGGKSLSSIFIPGTWPGIGLTGLEERVDDFIVRGFERIVVQGVARRLEQTTERLLGPLPVLEEPIDTPILSAEDIPEIKQLTAMIDGLAQVEANAGLFNALGGSRDPQDVVRLVSAVFGTALPPGAFTDGPLYLRCVKDQPKTHFEPGAYRRVAMGRLSEYLTRLFDRMFHGGSLVAQLQNVTVRLREAELLGVSEEADLAALRRLLDALDRAQDWLARIEGGEAGRDGELDLGPGFARLLNTIDGLAFFDPEARNETVRSGREEFERFRHKFAAYKRTLAGSTLVREESDGRLVLSPPLLALHGGLRTLFHLPFMSPRPERRIRARVGDGERVVWDAGKLDEAIAMAQAHSRFAADQPGDLQKGLRDRMTALARHRLGLALSSVLAEAQSVRPVSRFAWKTGEEEGLTTDSRDFRATSERISRLLGLLREAEVAAPYDALRAATLQGSLDLLGRVDRLFEKEALYRPGEALRDWDGSLKPTLLAFDAADDADVLQYLDRQRERINALLKDYAEPAVALLSLPDFDRDVSVLPQVRRWRIIERELGKYNGRKPGSSVAALERFIRFDMGGAATAECAAKFGGFAGGDRGGDPFLERRDALAAILWSRCQGFSAAPATSRYARLAGLFNRRLGGRYPFAVGAPEAGMAEADPETIRVFFRTYDGEAAELRKEIQTGKVTEASRDQAKIFLNGLDLARRFLGPVVDGDGGDSSDLYALQVDFRVNRDFEAGANQIIDWRLDIGRQTLLPQDKERRAAWRYGDPVRVILRWARNSPYRPVPGESGPPLVEGGDTAVFEYSGKWSLLRLLQVHGIGPGDFRPGAPPPPHMLRFEVATAPADPPRPDLRENRARGYIWIGVEGAGKSDSAAPRYPFPTFPVRAPTLVPEEGHP